MKARLFILAVTVATSLSLATLVAPVYIRTY